MAMDSALIARIGPEHRRQLAWFEEHEGQESGFPAPLEGGPLLVSKPKGIYKPQGLPYALSIRLALNSPYHDGVPRARAGWRMAAVLPPGRREPGGPGP